MLDVTPQGETFSGYGSIGSHVVGVDDSRYYLRIPHVDDNGNKSSDIINAYLQSGTRGVLKLVAFDCEGTVIEVPYHPESPDFSSHSMIGEIFAVAMLMEVLPSAPTLTKVIEEGDVDTIQQAYYMFGQELKKIHDSDNHLTIDQVEHWLRIGIMHPINGRERLLAIRPYIDINEGWIDEDAFKSILHSMEEIAEKMFNNTQQVVRVHGDAWRDNVLITPTRAVLFDNAVKFGVACNDVGFAVGDRVV